MSFGFHSYSDIIAFTKDNVNIKPTLSCDNNITAPNITVSDLIETKDIVADTILAGNINSGSIICRNYFKSPVINAEIRITAPNITAMNDKITALENHTHEGFDNITVNKINGCNINTSDGENKPFIPVVNSDGVVEVGKVIDFHNPELTNTNSDFDVRIICEDHKLSFWGPNYSSCQLQASNLSADNNERIAALEARCAALENKLNQIGEVFARMRLWLYNGSEASDIANKLKTIWPAQCSNKSGNYNELWINDGLFFIM